ncbi:MAG: hypothetical protein WCE21_01450 [Candidatus Babeliales bacterium]
MKLIEVILKLINWLGSSRASNMGTFLGGIGTLVLSFVAIFGARSIFLWKRQKQLEAKNKKAEEILIILNDYSEIFNGLLSNVFQVYSKDSVTNVQKIDELAIDKKELFFQSMQNDPMELGNYYKRLSGLLKGLGSLKIISKTINRDIPEQIVLWENFIKEIRYNLTIKNFINSTTEQITNASTFLSSASTTGKDEMNKNIDTIREKLEAFLYFGD